MPSARYTTCPLCHLPAVPPDRYASNISCYVQAVVAYRAGGLAVRKVLPSCLKHVIMRSLTKYSPCLQDVIMLSVKYTPLAYSHNNVLGKILPPPLPIGRHNDFLGKILLICL